MKTKFERSIKVTAEAVVRKPKAKQKVRASATLVESNPVVNMFNKRKKKEVLENKDNNVVTDKDIQNLLNALRRKK